MKILDLEISGSSYEEILAEIEKNINLKKHFSFLNVNAYITLTARNNSSLRNDLASFTKLFSDGIGILWASKFLYGQTGISERVNGTDLYYQILKLAEQKNWCISFFGGTEQAANNLENNLKKSFPKLHIQTVLARNLNFGDEIFHKIQSSESDILFLGIGTPYQEKWIATFGKKCNISVQIAAGSGIDFLSGVYRRAPKVLQQFGLEWFFRLIMEPKRLWRRYLIGIPSFIILIFKQKFFKSDSL